jgi:hypothetical protein
MEQFQTELALPEQADACTPMRSSDRNAEKAQAELQHSMTTRKVAGILSFLDQVSDEVGTGR